MQKLTRTLVLPVISSLCLITYSAKAEPQAALNEQALQAEAKARIAQFGSTLKGTLKQAIQSGGLVKGIEVCRDEAPRIAETYSTDGWKVGRTSHKVRNPDNQPDSWELEQINRFQKAMSGGQAAASLMVTQLQNDRFRLAKPIVTEGLCLACHGSQIADDVQAVLGEHYPQDLATGFSAGELRGIFSVEKSLP
ncbi:Tll0287-like domain-containing protein [Bowmanella pacifica]|uniref:Cytochrome c n=1 Tax=Bowmanella pacifica TaxID=502051 RepID=A0A918DKS9_9ALTE|nr:DUF3365 domain-containing protein [Bowmanella pacifica]GGO72714.1 cytochrome c [Bowmanella pacifica]